MTTKKLGTIALFNTVRDTERKLKYYTDRLTDPFALEHERATAKRRVRHYTEQLDNIYDTYV